MSPGLVVLGWAAGNAVLATILWFYDEKPLFVGLYAAAVLGTVLVAALVLLARRGTRGGARLPVASISAGCFALGATLLCLGWIYGGWFGYLGVFPFLLGLHELPRERLRANSVPAPTRVAGAPVRPARRHSGQTRWHQPARMLAATIRTGRLLLALRRLRRLVRR